jgi:anti-sigma-K factor RskA
VKVMRDDLHALTGSYVLDAISDAEREEFERHLQHCPTCAAEVRGLRETAARLALACAVTPPARMERRVLAATYQTRQLPPLSAGRPRRALPHRQALARRASSRSTFPRRTVTRRVAVLAAAASVAAAIALGITQLSAQHLDQARATSIARVVTAPDAHIETARTSAGGSVTVVTSAALREAVVSASGMASLPSSRVYQVWVLNSSGARSAGLMHGSSLLAAIRPGDRIGVTVEPAGGTARPTTTPVAVLPV